MNVFNVYTTFKNSIRRTTLGDLEKYRNMIFFFCTCFFQITKEHIVTFSPETQIQNSPGRARVPSEAYTYF